MAVVTQPVIADSGSEEVRLTRTQANAIAVALDALKALTATAATYANFQTAVAALDLSALRNLDAMPGIPAPRRFPSR